MTYETRTTQVTILPEGEPIFSEQATTIKIDDEAAGEFVVVEQTHGKPLVMITPEEWPAIREAIDTMIATCRDTGEPEQP